MRPQTKKGKPSANPRPPSPQKGKPKEEPSSSSFKDELSHPPPPPPPRRKQQTVKAIVVRDLPRKHKLGELRRWLQDENKGVVITGSRCLPTDDRCTGRTHSSLVLFLADSPGDNTIKDGKEVHQHHCLRLGRTVGSPISTEVDEESRRTVGAERRERGGEVAEEEVGESVEEDKVEEEQQGEEVDQDAEDQEEQDDNRDYEEDEGTKGKRRGEKK